MPLFSTRRLCSMAHGGRLLLLVVALQALFLFSRAQVNTIEPKFAIQPLYACKMEVKDLPQFEGMPSPEMTNGNLGLSAATLKMLEQWKIANNGDNSDTSNSNYNGITGDSSDSSSSGDSSGGTPSTSAAALSGVQRRNTRKASQTLHAAPAAPPPAPAPQVAPPPAPASYIISRPAATPAAAQSAPAASARYPALLYSSGMGSTTASGNSMVWPRFHGRYSSSTGAAASVAALDAVTALPAGAHSNKTQAAASRPGRWANMQHERSSVVAAAAGEDGDSLPPNTSPARRLFQAGHADKRVCNKGTPTNSTTGPTGKSSFSGKVNNILGITMADSGVIPADAAIAVGPNHVVHVVNSMVKIMPVNSNGEFPKSLKPGQVRLIPLPDWFGLVASPCDGGYITPSATYDKDVGRFLISAICGGDTNQVLLSVSADSSAMGTWILYSFAGEVTQGTRMQCINESYPVSFHSQVSYNKDGVFLTFIQNCPSNQETATGAMIYALPKWAVYKGAVYFWSPVWTAWDIYDAVGMKNNDDYYPGAFVQMQPVLPQRAADVQAEVTYFVSDNLNWVNPLRRDTFTVAALINTGSLWLYEGPNARSPAPLLVARIITRGMSAAIQTPDVKLTQPSSDPAAGVSNCQQLDGGAMRPPGVWDGGAVLYANKIYLVDRGPDLAVPFMGLFMPTLYWAILSPSFCVGGPCAPWFGTDWGWSDGWDWSVGAWQANSDRGRYGYKDPSYYNQVFLFPSASQPPPTSYIQGRRLQQGYVGAGSEGSSSSGSSSGGWSGPIPGSGVPIKDRQHMLEVVQAAQDHGENIGRMIKAAAAAAEEEMRGGRNSVTAEGMQAVLDPAFAQAASSYMMTHPNSSSSRHLPHLHATWANVSAAGAFKDRNVSAAFFGGGGGNTFMWQGWGMNTYYFDYYQWWREHYFMRNLYMNTRIPPKVNPCKYYKEWIVDNEVTFGAINSKHGVIEFVSQGDNPVGLTAPSVAVRGGSMLIAYSYSGPFNVPLTNGGIRAYPGVGYSVVDVNAPSSSGAAFNLAQAGAGCVVQGGITRWGSYSGADVHFPSYKIWTAVEYAYQPYDLSDSVSNAATQITVFS